MKVKELAEYYSQAEKAGKSVKEVADELCIHDATVRQYCKAHGITLRRVGNIGSGKRKNKK